jgi:predicted nucleic acid-binding protein
MVRRAYTAGHRGNCRTLGYLAAVAKQKRMTLAVVDGVIAATALEHDLTVVTRNVRDFDGLGLQVFNPWTKRFGS